MSFFRSLISLTSNASVISHTDTTHAIISLGCYLSSTSRTMPVISEKDKKKKMKCRKNEMIVNPQVSGCLFSLVNRDEQHRLENMLFAGDLMPNITLRVWQAGIKDCLTLSSYKISPTFYFLSQIFWYIMYIIQISNIDPKADNLQ